MRRRQPNSRMCFVCGMRNPIGLKIIFEGDGERVWANFTANEAHQGYPGVLHGGITFALLDEVIGRAAMELDESSPWMMTARAEMRYRKPVPIGEELTLVGQITRVRSRAVEGMGEIRLSDGSVAVEATAMYVKVPSSLAEQMKGRMAEEMQYWRVVEE
ncbi:MAG TPA: PaaI family thioesterase [Anaerolineae bacterium]|nr:PaaI family thioesterase [Anaerolineae bacterium]